MWPKPDGQVCHPTQECQECSILFQSLCFGSNVVVNTVGDVSPIDTTNMSNFKMVAESEEETEQASSNADGAPSGHYGAKYAGQVGPTLPGLHRQIGEKNEMNNESYSKVLVGMVKLHKYEKHKDNKVVVRKPK